MDSVTKTKKDSKKIFVIVSTAIVLFLLFAIRASHGGFKTSLGHAATKFIPTSSRTTITIKEDFNRVAYDITIDSDSYDATIYELKNVVEFLKMRHPQYSSRLDQVLQVFNNKKVRDWANALISTKDLQGDNSLKGSICTGGCGSGVGWCSDNVAFCCTPSYHFSCIEKGTQVLTQNGYVPVEKLSIGDTILSFNFEKKTLEPTKLVRKIKGEETQIIEVHTAKGNVLRITPTQIVFANHEWKRGAELKEGDVLMSYNPKTKSLEQDIIRDLNLKHLESQSEVYDLVLDKNNNFLANNVLLHNKHLSLMFTGFSCSFHLVI